MREFRGEVKSLGMLSRLVMAPLPDGLGAGPVETLFNRDVYFDAPDRTLRRRGVTCRFRTRIDDRRLLTLRVEPGSGSEGGPTQLYEAEVTELDEQSALAGSSDPARRLRAPIDPQLLTRRIEFETERRLRRSRPRWFAEAVYELCYDVVTVRAGGLPRTFQELKIRTLRGGWPGLDRLVTRIRRLGTVPAAPGRPFLEVWLVRRLGKGLAVPEGMQIQWVPLSEVVERVGAPVLHEPRTLAALAIAARSDLVPEWPNGPRPRGASRDSQAASPGVITREWAIAGLREGRPSAVEESALGLRDHFL